MNEHVVSEDLQRASVLSEILETVTAFSELEPAEEQYDCVNLLCLQHHLVGS